MELLTVGAPSESQFIGRALQDENTASDLLAHLIALDPAPLAQVLGLSSTDFTLAREVMLGGLEGTRKRRRADIVIFNGSAPLALLEVKIAASQHGGQFEAYESWAKSFPIPPRCFVLSLDDTVARLPAEWSARVLPEVLAGWTSSTNVEARLLASRMSAVFEDWRLQMSNPLGLAKWAVVADLSVRQLASELRASVWAESRHLSVSDEYKDSGGKAALYAFVEIPGATEDDFFSVDVRAGARADPAQPWIFRIGVHANLADRGLADAQRAANHIFQGLREDLALSRFKEHLREQGQAQIAELLKSAKTATDGLKRNGIYHDLKNRRLASQFLLDVGGISRDQLQILIQAAFDYLSSRAETRYESEPEWAIATD